MLIAVVLQQLASAAVLQLRGKGLAPAPRVPLRRTRAAASPAGDASEPSEPASKASLDVAMAVAAGRALVHSVDQVVLELGLAHVRLLVCSAAAAAVAVNSVVFVARFTELGEAVVVVVMMAVLVMAAVVLAMVFMIAMVSVASVTSVAVVAGFTTTLAVVAGSTRHLRIDIKPEALFFFGGCVVGFATHTQENFSLKKKSSIRQNILK